MIGRPIVEQLEDAARELRAIRALLERLAVDVDELKRIVAQAKA